MWESARTTAGACLNAWTRNATTLYVYMDIANSVFGKNTHVITIDIKANNQTTRLSNIRHYPPPLKNEK